MTLQSVGNISKSNRRFRLYSIAAGGKRNCGKKKQQQNHQEISSSKLYMYCFDSNVFQIAVKKI